VEFLLGATWLALNVWTAEHAGLLGAVMVAGMGLRIRASSPPADAME
jgi:hypothetical protein